RVHGTTGETPVARLARERAALLALPPSPYLPLAALGRRASRDGVVSYRGNAYSVPDTLTRAILEPRPPLTGLLLFADGQLLAIPPLLEGRGERRLAPAHRRARTAPPGPPAAGGPVARADFVEVERRPLSVYERVLG